MDAPIVEEAFVSSLKAEHRIVAAILFGSVARGTPRPDSDVDVAVLAADAKAGASLARDLIDVLGTLGLAAGRDVHLVDLARADPALRRSVFAHGPVLFDRSEGRLRELEVRTLLECFDDEYLRRLIDAGHDRRLERARG